MLLVVLASLAFVSAAPGNITTLCANLVSGYCAGSTFPAGYTAASCVAYFTNLTGITGATTTPGTDADVTGDTIGCRQYYSGLASATKPHYCNFGGGLGGGVCSGNPVTAACNSIMASCSWSTMNPFATVAACIANLSAGGTATSAAGVGAILGSKTGQAAAAENSLECRVYHSQVAGNGGPEVHCSHVTLPDVPTTCTGPVTVNADHYCGVINSACTGVNTQYNDDAQCKASFNNFPNGTGVAATVTEDGSSRQYHAQAAVATGNLVHCQHGGPSGGATVGSALTAWAFMANTSACQTAAYSYVGLTVGIATSSWLPADISLFAPTGNLANYTTGANGNGAGNTISCRIYHLSVATADATHCPHGDLLSVNGGCNGDAGNYTRMLCIQLLSICPALYNSSASCEADFNVLVAKGAIGTQATATGDNIACRVQQAFAAFATHKQVPATLPALCTNGNLLASGGVCKVKSSAPKLAIGALLFLPALFV